jgi:hypothetical protein
MDNTPKASKTHRARTEATEWRQKEDGTYDNRPTQKSEYFKMYARTHGCVKTVCEMCGKIVNKQEMRLHQQRQVCKNRHAWLVLNKAFPIST